MAYSEDYYLHLQGEQRGPYSFVQLKRLYDKNMIPDETLYWRDGLEQWQSVSELCGQPVKVQRKRQLEKRLVLGGAGFLAVILMACFAPIVQEGWKERSQHRYSSEAAYWRARGYVRDELKDRGAKVSFAPLDSTVVDLTGNKQAKVVLRGTVFIPGTPDASHAWDVSLAFEPDKKEWRLTTLRISRKNKP